MGWECFNIVFKNYKNEKGEGCSSKMSANTSEFLWKLSCSELISLSRLETFFVPTKEMLPIKNTKFCKEYVQQKTWLQGISCT